MYYGDDAFVRVVRFELMRAGELADTTPEGVSLQLVDGAGALAPWLLDVPGRRVYSPQRDASYPLVHATAGKEGPPPDLDRPAWLAFAESCDEVDGAPCVIHGRPRAVCARLVSALPDLQPGEDRLAARRRITVGIWPTVCEDELRRRFGR